MRVKKTMTAGSLIYLSDPKAGESLLKTMKSVPIPRAPEIKISSDLPMTLLHYIENHGTVEDSSRFSKADAIFTLAGSTQGRVDAKGDKAKFGALWGLCLNPLDQSLYVCDSGTNSIRKVTMKGNTTTFVNHGTISSPHGIVVHHEQQIFFVANYHSHTISKIMSSGFVKPFVGSGKPGYKDGMGQEASFKCPRGIAIDQQTGNVFVSEWSNHTVRMITPEGT
eukprot:Phypoly_transcript_06925.p1 GENE.Phypoly_transcript_06925~~Phypoly_transcript_06925.p1  ORF type:complete len:223 (-),score=27.08 Phypoly_transcript_06925:603-1271(-)